MNLLQQIGEKGAFALTGFSPDRQHRYFLSRIWSQVPKLLVVIGLNPSTADEVQDDPTIRRCQYFARKEGCGGLVMLNLFALRSTDPKALYQHPDPVGPENDETIRDETWGDRGGLGPLPLVVAAWGNHGVYRERGEAVLRLLPPTVWCWGTTKLGQPKHPLYLPSSARLVRYPVREGEG